MQISIPTRSHTWTFIFITVEEKWKILSGVFAYFFHSAFGLQVIIILLLINATHFVLDSKTVNSIILDKVLTFDDDSGDEGILLLSDFQWSILIVHRSTEEVGVENNSELYTY